VTRFPLFRETLALCGVLLEELGARTSPVALRLAGGAIRLLDNIALALGGFDQAEALYAADAELRTLRAQLLLAFELSLLPEQTYLMLIEQVDNVGRQIGGWRKKIKQSSAEAAPSVAF
jgi:hypothetical protein